MTEPKGEAPAQRGTRNARAPGPGTVAIPLLLSPVSRRDRNPSAVSGSLNRSEVGACASTATNRNGGRR